MAVTLLENPHILIHEHSEDKDLIELYKSYLRADLFRAYWPSDEEKQCFLGLDAVDYLIRAELD
jgi:hypothetical protein